MQIVLVILILFSAIVYVAWKLYRSITTPSNPCDDCPGCDLKKKSDGKFCQSE